MIINQSDTNHQFLLKAYEENNVEHIKQAILAGADPNFLLWNDNLEEYYCLYSNYAIIQQDFSLLPFMVEHGFSSHHKNPSLLNYCAIHNDLEILELCHSLQMNLFEYTNWVNLSIQNKSHDVALYFFNTLLKEKLQTISSSHLENIPSLVSDIIYFNDLTLLKKVCLFLVQHDLLAPSVQNPHYHNAHGDLRLLFYVEKAIENSDIDILEYLLHDNLFQWPISQDKLYAHLFSYAYLAESFKTIDYIWQQGYEFDLTTISSPDSQLVKTNYITVKSSIRKYQHSFSQKDVTDYIETYMSKKKYKEHLEKELPQHTAHTQLKL